ncbi:MAG: TSUP family transporter, partial [Bacteroidia bacterium]
FSLGQTNIQWKFLLTVTLIAIVGIFIGSYLSNKIDGKKLKPAFGWFVLIMGIYIILKETIIK